MLVEETRKYCNELEALELFLRTNKGNGNTVPFYENSWFNEVNHYEYQIKYYYE